MDWEEIVIFCDILTFQYFWNSCEKDIPKKNHTSFNISIVAKIVKIDELNSDPKSNKIISQEAF
jgi:hypothetical protein